MASIPANIRILWPSSASTPSGWATDTAFNDVMPYSGNSGSGTGGADNHTHNGNSHSHPGGSHSHSTSTTGSNCTQGSYYPPYGYLTWSSGGGGRGACHTHPASSLGSTTTGGSSGSNGNYSSGSSLPSYYTFRVIKSDGSGDGFPANSVVLWNTASNPTTESGWGQHGGSVGKFVRGASNGGAAAGGGSHAHPSSGNHTHGGGGGSHTHTAGNTSASSGSGGQNGGCVENYCRVQTNATHAHSVPSAGSGTAAGTANAASGGSAGGTTINDPPYISVWGVTNSSNSWLEGGIGFISGDTLSTFTDEGWVSCDGNNSTPNLNAAKYIKLSASGGAVGGTGSTTTHNHSGPGGHSHPGGGSHSHTLSASNTGTWTWPNGCGWGTAHPWGYGSSYNGTRVLSPNCHDHAFNSSTTNAAATAGYGSGTQGVAVSASIYPAYKTVTWLMAPEEPAAGGGNVGMFGANF
jgi:hypothetical protein